MIRIFLMESSSGKKIRNSMPEPLVHFDCEFVGLFRNFLILVVALLNFSFQVFMLQIIVLNIKAFFYWKSLLFTRMQYLSFMVFIALWILFICVLFKEFQCTPASPILILVSPIIPLHVVLRYCSFHGAYHYFSSLQILDLFLQFFTCSFEHH